MTHRREDTLTDSRSTADEGVQTRDLRLFRTGALRFAILDDDIAVIAEWRKPTPLPNAPPAVLGVVCIQGRMLTVLDTAILLGQAANGINSGSSIVALKGDEQLALLANKTDEQLTAQRIHPQPEADDQTMLGVIDHDGQTIGVLDVKELFGLAIRGRRRRQRRL